MSSQSSSESAQPAKTVVHPIYNSADADFILRVKDASNEANLVDFRVHKAKLAAASQVFADMFSLGKGGQQKKQDVLTLDGNSATWELLLQSIYNNPDEFISLHDCKAQILTNLWKLAHLYGMVTLYYYAEEAIIAQLPNVTPDIAFGICTSALLRHRDLLAQSAMTRASQGGLEDISEVSLAKAPSDVLATFVRRQHDRDMKKVRAAREQLRDGDGLKPNEMRDRIYKAKKLLDQVTG